jgi:hypothetical protein
LPTLQDRPLIAAVVNAIKEIASITGSFRASLIAWLADAGNGIGDLFATTIHAENVVATTGTFKKLCVAKSDGTPVCITGDGLDQILRKQSVSPAPSPATASTTPVPTTPTISTLTSPSSGPATSAATTTADAPPLVPDYNASNPSRPQPRPR